MGDFCVGVAAFPERHPRSPDFETDVEMFVAKCRAGADFAITQMFFRRRGLPAAARPGRRARLRRADHRRRHAGDQRPADHPDRAALRVRRSRPSWPSGSPRSTATGRRTRPRCGRSASRWPPSCAARLLAEGVPGIHFITMNRSTATREVYANLAPATARYRLTRPPSRPSAAPGGAAQPLPLGGVAADHADHRAGWPAPGGAACPSGGRRARRRSGRAAGRPARGVRHAGHAGPVAAERVLRGTCPAARASSGSHPVGGQVAVEQHPRQQRHPVGRLGRRRARRPPRGRRATAPPSPTVFCSGSRSASRPSEPRRRGDPGRHPAPTRSAHQAVALGLRAGPAAGRAGAPAGRASRSTRRSTSTTTASLIGAAMVADRRGGRRVRRVSRADSGGRASGARVRVIRSTSSVIACRTAAMSSATSPARRPAVPGRTPSRG